MAHENRNHSKTGRGSVSEDAETIPVLPLSKGNMHFLYPCASQLWTLCCYTSPFSSSREHKVLFLHFLFFPLWWKVCSQNPVFQKSWILWYLEPLKKKKRLYPYSCSPHTCHFSMSFPLRDSAGKGAAESKQAAPGPSFWAAAVCHLHMTAVVT